MKTPFVAQLGDVDCGPACVTAVLAAHGRHLRVSEVARACATGRDGTTAASLVTGARALGLTARPYRLSTGVGGVTGATGDHPVRVLDRTGLPAVTLMRGHHFVVAEEVTRRGVRVNDPARGHLTLTDDEFAADWTGLAVVVGAGPDLVTGGEPPVGTLRAWWRGEDTAGRVLTALGAVFAVLVSVASIAAVLLVRGVAGPVAGTGTSTGAGLESLVGDVPRALVALAGASWLAGWLGAHLRSRLLHRTVTRRSTQLVRHLLRVSPAFLQHRFSGEVAMRPQRIDGAAMQIVALLVDGAVGVLTVAAALTGILFASPAAFALVLAGLGANAYAIGHHLEEFEEAQRRAVGEQQRRDGEIVATLTAIETIRSEASPAHLVARWSAAQARVARLERRAHTIMLGRTRLSLLVDAGTTALVLLVCHTDRVPATTALVLVLLTGICLTAGRRVVSLGAFDLTQVRTALRLVDDVLLEPADGTLVPADATVDGLRLRDVAYTRPGSRRPLFEGVELTVGAGGTCFVVGDSGAGKSTLARIVVGALAASHGEVSRPDRIAYVPQRALFLEGTVASNLTLGREVADGAVGRALALVRMDEVVGARGGADRAEVTQGGRNFSGGERQRLALARALLHEPSLLVLDEAFSAMDDQLTDELHRRLRDLRLTIVSVAHHLPTRVEGDLVVRLADGRLTRDDETDAGADPLVQAVAS